MIHTVTTMKLDTRGNIRRSRCIGYFLHLDNAKASVEVNAGDIYESGWYTHVVIEGLPEGLYPVQENRVWYRWSDDDHRWVQCEQPDGMEAFAGFSIG